LNNQYARVACADGGAAGPHDLFADAVNDRVDGSAAGGNKLLTEESDRRATRHAAALDLLGAAAVHLREEAHPSESNVLQATDVDERGVRLAIDEFLAEIDVGPDRRTRREDLLDAAKIEHRVENRAPGQDIHQASGLHFDTTAEAAGGNVQL